ncbi:hypothetical protein ACFIJ5_07150 [Haloimpatiens sp. FM7330]
MKAKVLKEYEVMEEMLKQKNINDDLRGKIIKIYNTFKFSVPKSIRNICRFRYYMTKREGYIKMYIYNYRAFLLPYEQNKVQIIYPQDEINTLYSIMSEKRIKQLCNFCKFNTFPCYVLYLTVDEVYKFKKEHWNCFKNACILAAHAPYTKIVKDTVTVNWGKRL